MAIDKVQEFALAFPHIREDEVLSCLHGAGIVHLTSYTPSTDSQGGADAALSLDVCRPEREQSLSHIADELGLASATLSFFAEVNPVTKGLVLSFFPDEVYVSVADYEQDRFDGFKQWLHGHDAQCACTESPTGGTASSR